MAYVDGFVIPVPTGSKDTYRKWADRWGPWFLEQGAIKVYECWGDDVPAGKVTDFQRAVDLKDNETVVFSFSIWPDKDTRNAAWTKITEIAPEDIPFDGKRMILGGFTPLAVFG